MKYYKNSNKHFSTQSGTCDRQLEQETCFLNTGFFHRIKCREMLYTVSSQDSGIWPSWLKY